MPQLSSEFWMQIVLYTLSVGVLYGGINWQLKSLTEKVNKHNNLIERMFLVEASTKSAHKRLDEMHDEIHHLQGKGE